MNNLIFTTIQHIPRKKHWLSMNDYILCDMISQLSNNPKYNWCILSKDSMAEEISVSRKTIFNIIDEMIKKWFLERDAETKFLRTTQLWYDEFKVYTHSVKITPIVQKLHDDSVKITLDDSVKITPYNNTIYKDIIISSKEDRQVTEKKEYWDPIINSIIETIKNHNNWIIDGTIVSNRKHGKMLRDKIWKITGFNWDYINFLSTLIERTDQYNISKTTSCESIYYNLASLVAKIKTTHIETVKKEEDQKPKVWSNRILNSLTTT